jgi:hypothetical protein
MAQKVHLLILSGSNEVFGASPINSTVVAQSVMREALRQTVEYTFTGICRVYEYAEHITLMA